MEKLLFPGETLEELGCGSLVLIQKKEGFRFGTDAVLLADFAKDVSADTALDLCCGNGIIPVLLSYKSPASEIYGLEIQPEIHEMSVRSIQANNLNNKVQLFCGDLKDCCNYFDKRSFDLVTCNPPYMCCGRGKQGEDISKNISRHEIACTLEDVIRAAEIMLRQNGHLCMIHRPARLSDIITLMRKYSIEPKRLRMVHPKADQPASLVLIDGLWHGGNELKVLPPLILYNSDGTETDELRQIYERE